MEILIVAATQAELAPFYKEVLGEVRSADKIIYNAINLELLVTGVGLAATASRLSRALSHKKYDLVINIGIAGAYDHELRLGDVVFVEQDTFGDLGAELADGRFADAVDLGLSTPDEVHTSSLLSQQSPTLHHLICNSAICVRGLTVNTVSGTLHTIAARQGKYHPQTESMEGAAFYDTCRLYVQSGVQVRAISNYVTPRNRDEWDIGLAIRNINQWLSDFIGSVASHTAPPLND